MTIITPEGVSTLGNESVWFIPAIANPVAGITVAEATAGTPLQTAINAFVAQGEQGVTSDMRLSSVEEYENPGRNKVSIEPFEIVYDPQDLTNATTYKAYSVLPEGTSGFLVDRRGLPHATAWAVTQDVIIYPVKIGAHNEVPVEAGSEGNKFKVKIKAYISGPKTRSAIVA